MKQSNISTLMAISIVALGLTTMMSGVAFSDSLTLTAPNGGEELQVDSTFTIRWTSSGSISNVALRYTPNANSANPTYYSIEYSTANDGSYVWTVPNDVSKYCKVVINSVPSGAADDSDSYFEIYKTKLTLTAPNGGEKLQVGSNFTIKWTWSGDISNVALRYTPNANASSPTYYPIVDNTANDGSYVWTVPDNVSKYCKVVINSVPSGAADHSDSYFEIYSPSSISVTPSSRDFGSVQVGSYLDLPFTVQNSGGGTLSGSASTSAPFSIQSGGTYNLPAGQSQTVTVRFSPTAAQSYNGTVTFTGGGGATRPVSGTGYSDVQATWTCDTYNPCMDETYTVDLIVVPGSSWRGGTVDIALDEVPWFTPTPLTWAQSYLRLDDKSSVFYYKNIVNPDGTLEPAFLGRYRFGDTVPLYVPAEGGAGLWFEIRHKWYWIPPYDLGEDIFGKIASACAGELGKILTGIPGGGIPFTTLMAILTELRAVNEIEYRYTGYCNGVNREIGPVRVEVCLNKYEQFRLSATMQITASVSTTFAVMLGWNPAGWAAAATEVGLWIAGGYQYSVAADPPDFNYTQISHVEVPEVPEIADIDDAGLRQVSEDALLLPAVTRAFGVSMERYYGAVADGALEWQTIQLEAAMHYLFIAQELSARLSSYWSIIAPSLPVPTAADIEAARQDVFNNGLPDIEVSCLLAFGYDQNTIDYIASVIATLDDEYFMDPNRIAYGFATISNSLRQTIDGLPEVPASVISSIVDIEPYVLNLKVDDTWTTCYIELPEGNDVTDINIVSVRLNATISPDPSVYEFADYDADGIADLMLKFDEAPLVQGLNTVQYGQDILVSVTGQLKDGTKFAGTDTIVVANPCTEALTFSGYDVLDQNRVSRAEFEYTFQLRATNNSLFDLEDVVVRLVAEPNNTIVLDDMVKFSSIRAGTEALSDDTFKVQIDRSFEGLVSDVVWQICDCKMDGEADLSSYRSTDFKDFATFAQAWLSAGDAIEEDLYPDGKINLKDLSILLEAWLR